MSTPHRFVDEWLARAAASLPGVAEAGVARLRAEKHPVLAYALVAAGLATPEAVAAQVHRAYGIAPVDSAVQPDKLAVSLIPEAVCRRARLVPLRVREDSVEVAMANPLDHEAQGEVRAITGRAPVPLYVPPDRLERLLAESFSDAAVVFDLLDKLDVHESVEVVKGGAQEDEDIPDAASVHAPIIRLADALITKAVTMRASDIHIEHEERHSNVRFRVDGVLKKVMSLPRAIGAGALVARVKIMADLDIAEHRKPQDGRAKLRVGRHEMGLRVSILPTSFGEKVVLRLLDSRAAEVPLDKLGFPPDTARRLEGFLSAGQGMLLVTGPTGSGKTTTLYAMLHRLRGESTNIVTVEDPIEYKLKGVNQVQVQTKQGLGFAAVLRSVLRQDPDVILVGEIRDAETADIAFQAAMTGHFVLSTLHTNDTVGAVTRLADMGVERFKLAPALIAVTAQRLVRRLCPLCRVPVPPAEQDPAAAAALKGLGHSTPYYRAGGCDQCLETGYSGRLSLLEILDVSPDLRSRISGGETEEAIRTAAFEAGALRSLRQDALEHLAAGTTTLEEIAPYVDLAVPARPSKTPTQKESRRREEDGIQRALQGSRRVLVADDDPAIRSLLRGLLEGEGYSVSMASDGEEALRGVAQDEPQMLVLDLDMPLLDGYGVVRRLRQEMGVLSLPILILTAAQDESSQTQALRLGADDYVTKPFKPAVMLARIGAAFRRLELQ